MIQPTIYAGKKLITQFSKEREIELICDLHGHSRNMGIFMYGCENPESPSDTRIIPRILSKLTTCFKYNLCSFRMQKSKESTLRISMFKELKIPNIFTLESSFCGSDGFHYSVEDLMNMGKNLCISLLITANIGGIPSEISFNKDDIIKEFKEDQSLLIDNPDNVSGSDSDPSEDNLDEEVISKLIPHPLPKVRKSRIKSKDYKKLTKIEKKSLSEVRRRDNYSTRRNKQASLERKFEQNKKCEECGEIEFSNHVCAKKFKSSVSPTPTVNQRKMIKSSTVNSNITVYVNIKGKTVRDQATQTMYIRKMQNSESKSLYNSSLLLPSPIKSKLDALPKMILDTQVNTKELNMPTLGHISSVLDINRKRFKKRF